MAASVDKDRNTRTSSRSPAGEPQRQHRGHDSFHSAFEEALQVTQVGVRPREIRVRWNRGDGSYTWTVKY